MGRGGSRARGRVAEGRHGRPRGRPRGRRYSRRARRYDRPVRPVRRGGWRARRGGEPRRGRWPRRGGGSGRGSGARRLRPWSRTCRGEHGRPARARRRTARAGRWTARRARAGPARPRWSRAASADGRRRALPALVLFRRAAGAVVYRRSWRSSRLNMAGSGSWRGSDTSAVTSPASRTVSPSASRTPVPGSTRSPLTKVPFVECSSRIVAWPASSTVTVACRLDTFSYLANAAATRESSGSRPSSRDVRLVPRRCRSGKPGAARRGRSVPSHRPAGDIPA